MRAKELDHAATMCRTLGHSWMEVIPEETYSTHNWGLYLQCERCTTKRFDEISNRTGELEWRKYKYPRGYQRSRVPMTEKRLVLKQILRVYKSVDELEMF